MHFLFRNKLFYLPLIFLFTFCTREIRKEVSGWESLYAKVVSLYTIMEKYDVRKYYIRNKIEKFFCTPEDLDLFIFKKGYEITKVNAKDGRVAGFDVRGISEMNETVNVKVEYSVRTYLPFLKKKIETVDEWVRPGDDWCIVVRERIKVED